MGINPQTILDAAPEFQVLVNGTVSTTVSIGTPKLVGNVWEYAVSGLPANGLVTVRFISGSFGDNNGALTMGEDESTVFTAVTAGARGYLLKGADAEEVIQAIRTVHGGGVVFGASLAQRIARVFATGPSARAPEAFPQLSDREREILDLVAAGLSNPDIAARLYLSPKTVRNNVSAILTKLQARDRSAAIIRAREAGLGRASS